MKMHDVIYGPLITEKAAASKDDYRTLSFKVSSNANKTEIKRAVESIYKVSVIGVNTLYTKKGKRAIVKLSDKDSAQEIYGRLGQM